MEALVVDKSGEITSRNQPRFVRVLAHIISYVFHPLFITTYLAAYLIFLHPYVFAGFDLQLRLFRLVTVVLNTALIPGFAVFLMWRLKLIDSMHLSTSKERIIPYAAAMIFYFWAWLVLKKVPGTPPVFATMIQGSFFAVVGAWIINIQSKISMHTTAMGGLVTFFLLFSFSDDSASGLYLSLAFLLAGLVGTARLIVSDHTRFQIVQGFVVGALAYLVAWMI
jgi:hypothetical protein